MRNSEQLTKLKTLLEGKTIRSVEEATIDEGVCRITTTEGSCFTLCATDLGFWVRETVCAGVPYKSLGVMFSNYDDLILSASSLEDAPTLVVVSGNTLRVTTPLGKVFEVDIDALSDWEKRVVRHRNGAKIISLACQLGDMWKCLFKNPEAYDDEQGTLGLSELRIKAKEEG
jgi:hypothetical protein